MNGVLLLAGPPAVGHNTVAAILASSDSPVAVVDGDDLRAMVNHPAAPGSGPEWERQYDVCVRNLCAIASNFDPAGLGDHSAGTWWSRKRCRCIANCSPM